MATQADTQSKSRSEYTVGWICALPKEQTAAMAMLDKKHLDLPQPSNDHNIYTLGSIGKHNIVIACLPKGRYGTNSAATVATQMVRTFPSIKIGLLVGIGGGIPPKVRLGDVVVSTPVGGFPGVVQWDISKTKDGNFERTESLNNSPTSLLTALTKLETEHDLNGTKIPEFLDELKLKWPRLAPRYLKCDSYEDPLHIHEFHHSQSRWKAILTLWEMILALVTYLFGWREFTPSQSRPEQVASNAMDTIGDGGQHKPRHVRVHYGLIASGNQVIKDAIFRDKLDREFGGHILCVEMEAAGLMNNFPCIVIRGICDYADSHKNKEWQEHSATVAAAFAKELLEYVQPSDVDEECPVKEFLGQKQLLATGRVNPDFKDSDRPTPLSFALLKGHESVVERLVATGKVDQDSKGSNGQTPLSLAAEHGHEAVVMVLLKECVDLESKDTLYGLTPLLLAAQNGHEVVVRLLLEKGADLGPKTLYMDGRLC